MKNRHSKPHMTAGSNMDTLLVFYVSYIRNKNGGALIRSIFAKT